MLEPARHVQGIEQLLGVLSALELGPLGILGIRRVESGDRRVEACRIVDHRRPWLRMVWISSALGPLLLR